MSDNTDKFLSGSFPRQRSGGRARRQYEARKDEVRGGNKVLVILHRLWVNDFLLFSPLEKAIPNIKCQLYKIDSHAGFESARGSRGLCILQCASDPLLAGQLAGVIIGLHVCLIYY